MVLSGLLSRSWSSTTFVIWLLTFRHTLCADAVMFLVFLKVDTFVSLADTKDSIARAIANSTLKKPQGTL